MCDTNNIGTRSGMICVNFCSPEELRLIPGVGPDIAARLMNIRREGSQITRVILECIIRRELSVEVLAKLDFRPIPQYVGHPKMSSVQQQLILEEFDPISEVPRRPGTPQYGSPAVSPVHRQHTFEEFGRYHTPRGMTLPRDMTADAGLVRVAGPRDIPMGYTRGVSLPPAPPRLEPDDPVRRSRPPMASTYVPAQTQGDRVVPEEYTRRANRTNNIAKGKDIDQFSVSELPDPPAEWQLPDMKVLESKVDKALSHIADFRLEHSRLTNRAEDTDSDGSSTHGLPRKGAPLGISSHRSSMPVHMREDSSSEDSSSTSSARRTKKVSHSKMRMKALKEMPRTLTFNGKSNWHAFRLKFTRYADVSTWTEDDCRDCLLHCLTDQALQYGAMLLRSQPTMPYRRLLHKLEQRFGAEELPAAAQVKFQQASQKSGETIEEWADRVQTMATEAFRELPESYSNQQVIARFCQGLRDTEAGHSTFMRSFRTLEDAMNEVRLFQHSKQAMSGKSKHTSHSSTAVDYDESVMQVSAVQNRTKPESNVESVLAQLQLELKEVKTQLQRKSAYRGRGRGAGGVGRDQSRVTCWLCDQKGHIHKDCPMKQSLNKSGSETRANPRPPSPQASAPKTSSK